MKRIIVYFLLLLSGILCEAQEYYVQARKIILYKEPSLEAQKLDIILQNTKLNILAFESDWCRVAFGSSKGWIVSKSIDVNPYVVPIYIQNRSEISTIKVRKRASNFTSSAAASRGLAKDCVKDRSKVSFDMYDFGSVIWLESNFIFDFDLLRIWSIEEFDNRSFK